MRSVFLREERIRRCWSQMVNHSAQKCGGGHSTDHVCPRKWSFSLSVGGREIERGRMSLLYLSKGYNDTMMKNMQPDNNKLVQV